MRLLRARSLVTMTSAPIDDGAVVIDAGKIVTAGQYKNLRREFSTAPVEDLGEQILMPGLVNAHCHLDYSMMRNAILPNGNFAHWIQRINALKAQFSIADYHAAIALGFQEAVTTGTTSLINIEALPEVMLTLAPPPIRTWWCLELLDIRQRHLSDATMMGMLQFFDATNDWLGGFGLSPHAPYTASLDLYRFASQYADQQNTLFTTHVAESRDEFQMFYDGDGPLFHALKKFDRPMDDCGQSPPLSHLLKAEALAAQSLLVHLNELTDQDFELLARRQPTLELSVVHCPQSHRYFDHAPFRYHELCKTGMNICLGTDSLASSPSLNMFDEMRCMAERIPNVSAEEIVTAATVNGAKALHQPGSTATIIARSHADLITIPTTAPLSEIYQTIVHNTTPVAKVMVNGEWLASQQEEME